MIAYPITEMPSKCRYSEYLVWDEKDCPFKKMCRAYGKAYHEEFKRINGWEVGEYVMRGWREPDIGTQERLSDCPLVEIDG